MKEFDVEMYAVGIFEPLGYRARTPEEADGPSLLADLAQLSGGRMFSVEDPNELPDIMPTRTATTFASGAPLMTLVSMVPVQRLRCGHRPYRLPGESSERARRGD